MLLFLFISVQSVRDLVVNVHRNVVDSRQEKQGSQKQKVHAKSSQTRKEDSNSPIITFQHHNMNSNIYRLGTNSFMSIDCNKSGTWSCNTIVGV